MRYFGGKVGLLEAVFDEAWIVLNARVQGVVKSKTRSREALLEALMAITSALARDTDLGILFMFEGRRLRGDHPRVRLSTGFVEFSDSVRGLVRKAQAAGDIDPSLDAVAITSSILGATESLIRDRLLAKAGGRRAFGATDIRRTIDAMLSGFERSRQRKVSR